MKTTPFRMVFIIRDIDDIKEFVKYAADIVYRRIESPHSSYTEPSATEHSDQRGDTAWKIYEELSKYMP